MRAANVAGLVVWRFACLAGGWALYGVALPFLWVSRGFSGVGRLLRRASDWLFMRAFSIKRRAREVGGV
jgi:hypothetical protein